MSRRRFGRPALALLLCLAVAPGLWWRSEKSELVRSGALAVAPLAVAASRGDGEVTLAGAWELASDDARFGGYSALVVRAGGRLRAYSDSGTWLDFTMPDRPGGPGPVFGIGRLPGGKYVNDIEAAAYDPASGTTWLALEFTNSIRRVDSEIVEVAPAAMAGFRDNGGSEAMARLPDGRFVVLAESAAPLSPMRRTGLLFATDPVRDPRATVFAFDPPAGYDPTDAATLPDGRVLILLRGLKLTGYPLFESMLVVADPADIESGRPWPWREVAHLSNLAPRENYEGLAIVPGEQGLELWLIADANDSVVLQRTLLLKLIWREEAQPGDAASAGRGLRRAAPPS
jgi:hypothetical protein